MTIYLNHGMPNIADGPEPGHLYLEHVCKPTDDEVVIWGTGSLCSMAQSTSTLLTQTLIGGDINGMLHRFG